jgi:hypothetical protein
MEDNQNEEEKNLEAIANTSKEIHYHHYGKKKEGVNFGSLFLAILLILVGFFYLAKNTGWIDLNFNINWWQFWPLLIIASGLSMLSGRGWFSVVIGILVILLSLGTIVIVIINNSSFDFPGNGFYKESISIDKEPNISSAVVNIKMGAAEININGKSDKLLDGSFGSDFLKLKTESKVDNNIQELTLAGDSDWEKFKGGKTVLDLHVNPNTVLELNMDTGAVKMNLDLRDIMAEKIDINTGASKVNLILGFKVEESNLYINGGASSINILLPKSVGAKLKIISALSSRKLIDFKQIDDNNYESNNYQLASKKIDINLSLGVSSLDINWY